jgi:hypothetical protein
MVIAGTLMARGAGMQLTYEEASWVDGEDELAPEQTRNIPFFGFVTGTVLSLLLWGAIGWTIWAVLT